MFYGPNYAVIYRRTAYYVDRLLKGTSPAESPFLSSNRPLSTSSSTSKRRKHSASPSPSECCFRPPRSSSDHAKSSPAFPGREHRRSGARGGCGRAPGQPGRRCPSRKQRGLACSPPPSIPTTRTTRPFARGCETSATSRARTPYSNGAGLGTVWRRLPALAAELVGLCSRRLVGARAPRRSTADHPAPCPPSRSSWPSIPCDPVGAGLVPSLAHRGAM